MASQELWVLLVYKYIDSLSIIWLVNSLPPSTLLLFFFYFLLISFPFLFLFMTVIDIWVLK